MRISRDGSVIKESFSGEAFSFQHIPPATKPTHEEEEEEEMKMLLLVLSLLVAVDLGLCGTEELLEEETTVAASTTTAEPTSTPAPTLDPQLQAKVSVPHLLNV